LNKTLFQTQIYLKKRYIHRLHVLNPLTNSDIIGNVNYYLVRPRNAQEAITVQLEIPEEPKNSNEVVIDIEPSTDQVLKIDDIPHNTSKRKLSLVYDQTTPLSPLVEIMPELEALDLVVKTNSVAFEELSDKPVVPNAMNMLKRTVTVKSTVGRTLSVVEKPINNMTTNKTSKNFPKLTITTQLPTGLVSVNGPTSAVIEAGIITRFTVPVPKEEMGAVIPKTQKGHRRTLSYRNAVSASGVPASFLEWARMVQEESTDGLPNSTGGEVSERDPIDFDVVKPFARNSPSKALILSPDRKHTPKLAPICDDEELEEQSSPVDEKDQQEVSTTTEEENEKGSPEIVFIDAIYIANDNDFLETSKIRQIFRSNAINPEDAKLFQMKEYTGQDANEQPFEIVGDSFPCEGCYPSEQELASMSPCVRFFHVHKCLILASMISILVIVFILVMMFTNFNGPTRQGPN
jgi:hypothetical protein